MDIHIDVPAVKFRELSGDTHPETDSSTTIRKRVIAARERQTEAIREREDLPECRNDTTNDPSLLSN